MRDCHAPASPHSDAKNMLQRHVMPSLAHPCMTRQEAIAFQSRRGAARQQVPLHSCSICIWDYTGQLLKRFSSRSIPQLWDGRVIRTKGCTAFLKASLRQVTHPKIGENGAWSEDVVDGMHAVTNYDVCSSWSLHRCIPSGMAPCISASDRSSTERLERSRPQLLPNEAPAQRLLTMMQSRCTVKSSETSHLALQITGMYAALQLRCCQKLFSCNDPRLPTNKA